MAIFQSFTIGKDQAVAIEIANAAGALIQAGGGISMNSLDLGILERFHSQPIGDELKVTPATKSGKPVFRNLQSGWEGDLEFARNGIVGDLLQQVLQEGYHGSNGAIIATIHHTIYDPQGSAYGEIGFIYPDAVLRMTDSGEYRAEEKVVQRWSFKSPQRDLVKNTAEPGSQGAILLALYTTLAAGNVVT